MRNAVVVLRKLYLRNFMGQATHIQHFTNNAEGYKVVLPIASMFAAGFFTLHREIKLSSDMLSKEMKEFRMEFSKEMKEFRMELKQSFDKLENQIKQSNNQVNSRMDLVFRSFDCRSPNKPIGE